MVKSPRTTHFVLMLSRTESVQEMERGGRGFMMDCSRAKGARLVTRPRTQRASERGTCHLECEAAGVILRDTAR